MLLQLLLVVGVTLTTSSPVPNDTTISRIVNGYEVTDSQIPYQVSLRRKVSSGWAHFCGAVIVKSKVVVTAAHCVDVYVPDPTALRAVVGTISRISGGTGYDVSKVILHEDYSESTLVNDIALIGTSKVISFGQNVSPVTFPYRNFVVADGTEAIVSGFGTTSYEGSASNVLLAAKVKIVNQASCLLSYLKLAVIVPEMICAGASDPPRDACQGDSGGPLVANNFLIGVVSWGAGCADEKYPGVYTRVSQYRNWYDKNVNLFYKKQS